MADYLFGLSKIQLLTLLLTVAVVIPTWATYSYSIYGGNVPADTTHATGKVPNTNFASFIQAWNVGLPFLFAGYAFILKTGSNAKEERMYKNVVLILSIAAWALVIARPIGGGATLGAPANDSWDQVAKYVATGLAAGSLFALPVTYVL